MPDAMLGLNPEGGSQPVDEAGLTDNKALRLLRISSFAANALEWLIVHRLPSRTKIYELMLVTSLSY